MNTYLHILFQLMEQQEDEKPDALLQQKIAEQRLFYFPITLNTAFLRINCLFHKSNFLSIHK